MIEGRYGPWSDTIHIYCLPSPITTSPYISSLTENVSSVVINWTFPDSLEARIDGFKVLRSNLPNGDFQPVSSLIGKHLRTWSDNSPIPTAYYKISVKDDTETELASFEKLFQLEDTEPPGAPIGLSGTCDASGKIQLIWTAPSDPDVRGYRVFTSYNETGDILERTTEPVNDTMFTFYEDIKRNNKFIHVYVEALDFHANNSEMAKNKVKIYDIVPPSAPQLLHVGQHPYGFILDVKSSPDAEVELYKIQRRLGSDNEWSTMHTISDWTTSGLFTVIDNDRATWIDTTTLPSMPHAYRIIAEDEAGNAGASKTKYVDPHQVGNRPAIQNANVSMFTTGPGKFMRVGWSYSDTNDIESYQIYRQVNQYPMLSYRSTAGTSAEAAEDWPGVSIPGGQGELFFVDLLLDNVGNLYNTSTPVNKVKYRIVARHYDGTTSPLSPIVELIF